MKTLPLSPSQELRKLFDSLGKQEKRVARSILGDYPMSALGTVVDLAEASSVSTATVLRLVNRLGFETFGLFQQMIKKDLRALLESPSERLNADAVPSPSQGEFLQNVFEQTAENLRTATRTILESDFQDVLNLLSEPQRTIYCIGGRYSAHIANLFAEYLGVMRNKVHCVDGQPDGWPRFLTDIGPTSTVIVIDIRRYQQTICCFGTLAKQQGAKLILITDIWKNPLQAIADYEFCLPSASPSPMDSLAVPLVFVETLIGAFAAMHNELIRKRLATCDTLDCVGKNEGSLIHVNTSK